MSNWFQTFLAVCLVVVIIGGTYTSISAVSYCYTVDYSQAKFEPGDMVRLKVGGIGQVIKRFGHNEGSIWNLEPVYEYEVRQSTVRGTQTTTFQEWELENEPC